MFEIYVPTIQYSWIMSQDSNQTIVTILNDDNVVIRNNAAIFSTSNGFSKHLTFRCDNAVNKQVERHRTKAAV